MTGELPRFIDFEATGLHIASYPIEIAWSEPEGVVEAHLISPEGVASWRGQADEAIHIHRITPTMLQREGKSPRWVVERMRERLTPGPVYSDAPLLDQDWLEKLFAAAGETLTTFAVLGINRIPELAALDDPTFARLRRQAERTAGGRHRAGVDVRCMVEMYRLAVAERGGAIKTA